MAHSSPSLPTGTYYAPLASSTTQMNVSRFNVSPSRGPRNDAMLLPVVISVKQLPGFRKNHPLQAANSSQPEQDSRSACHFGPTRNGSLRACSRLRDQEGKGQSGLQTSYEPFGQGTRKPLCRERPSLHGAGIYGQGSRKEHFQLCRSREVARQGANRPNPRADIDEVIGKSGIGHCIRSRPTHSEVLEAGSDFPHGTRCLVRLRLRRMREDAKG